MRDKKNVGTNHVDDAGKLVVVCEKESVGSALLLVDGCECECVLMGVSWCWCVLNL